MFRLLVLVSGTALAITSGYCSNLGQLTLVDPLIGQRSITYEKKGDYAVVEGDILLAKISQLQQQGAVITRKKNGSRWSQGIIPYAFDKNLPETNRFAALQAMEYIQQHTNIEFITIDTAIRDYIYFTPAEGTTCSSYVGRQGGQQVIQLAPRCNVMNTVHEIGHALGLWHEQSRADRDNYISILWENIEEDHKFNFEQKITNGKDYGDYDYESIMHYGMFAFSKNGLATIIPLIPGVEIGQRSHLSAMDIAAINGMYPGV